jgi:hypothetical protein
MALAAVGKINVLGPPRLSNNPRLRISSSTPKITPLIPASDSMRLAVSE